MKHYDTMTGFKATDANMQCRGFQYVLGEWHKHEGKLALYESGFHFCEHPSGPSSFYSNEGTRMFRVEAKNFILGKEPGSDLKHVALEMRLVEEIIIPAGDGNTGNRNTGNWNTGNGNATDACSGHLCCKIQPVVIFDQEVAEGAHIPYWLINELSSFLEKDDVFDIEHFLSIPNATREGILALHAAHIARRKVQS